MPACTLQTFFTNSVPIGKLLGMCSLTALSACHCACLHTILFYKQCTCWEAFGRVQPDCLVSMPLHLPAYHNVYAQEVCLVASCGATCQKCSNPAKKTAQSEVRLRRQWDLAIAAVLTRSTLKFAPKQAEGREYRYGLMTQIVNATSLW